MPVENLIEFPTRDARAAINPVVRALLDGMEARSIRYCHWKSNMRLADALSGDDDIDVLVDRRDACAFHALLAETGFKLAVSRARIGHPGVFHAFALDPDSARLIHLHAYSQVVTGDSLVKAYRLPIEHELLEDTRLMHGVRVPQAEAELVLFAVRNALKHTSLAEIAMVSRHYAGVVAELDWLRGQCDVDRAAKLCASWFPAIDERLFHALLAAIGTERAVARRIRLGFRVAHALKGLRRFGRAAAFLDRARRIAALGLSRFTGRRDLALATGGAVIALVGPKAVGKTTLGTALQTRLGEHLDVRRIHAGKPPATPATWLLHLAIPLGRRLFPRERPGEYEKPERREKSPSRLYVLRMAMLAHDRRHLLRKAMRAATAGTIVICDRYPSLTVGSMDSVQFSKAQQARAASALKRGLMRLEEKFCLDLPPPGLVVRLQAPLGTSLARDRERGKEGGPDADAVERRRALESNGDYGSAPVAAIDTDRPIDVTVRDTVCTVWNSL